MCGEFRVELFREAFDQLSDVFVHDFGHGRSVRGRFGDVPENIAHFFADVRGVDAIAQDERVQQNFGQFSGFGDDADDGVNLTLFSFGETQVATVERSFVRQVLRVRLLRGLAVEHGLLHRVQARGVLADTFENFDQVSIRNLAVEEVRGAGALGEFGVLIGVQLDYSVRMVYRPFDLSQKLTTTILQGTIPPVKMQCPQAKG
ncbi:hypothetical protein [Achromobacter phage shaaii_LB5]|nr:hypothetical protein [Achromobacter phage shaaii_LB5]